MLRYKQNEKQGLSTPCSSRSCAMVRSRMHGNQKCGSRTPWTRVAAYGGLTLTSNSIRGCHAAFKGAAPKSKAPRLGLVWLSVIDGCHRARLKNRGCSFRSMLGKKLSVEREFGQCSYERHRPRLDGDVVRSETDSQLTCATRRSCRPVFYILPLFKEGTTRFAAAVIRQRAATLATSWKHRPDMLFGGPPLHG